MSRLAESQSQQKTASIYKKWVFAGHSEPRYQSKAAIIKQSLFLLFLHDHDFPVIYVINVN